MRRKYSPVKEDNKGYCGHVVYKLTYPFAYVFFHKYKIEYKQEFDKNAYHILVSNHSQAYGPIEYCLSMNKTARIWTTHEIMYRKKFPDYAIFGLLYDTKHPKLVKFIAKILSPYAQALFRGAPTIPVYRDMRIITTFKKSLQTLEEGKYVVILAEEPTRHDEYVNQLNEGFINVGRYIKGKSDKKVIFHPTYLCPDLKRIVIGEGIEYIDETNKQAMVLKIRDKISELGKELPKHKPVNYNNYD